MRRLLREAGRYIGFGVMMFLMTKFSVGYFIGPLNWRWNLGITFCAAVLLAINDAAVELYIKYSR